MSQLSRSAAIATYAQRSRVRTVTKALQGPQISLLPYSLNKRGRLIAALLCDNSLPAGIQDSDLLMFDDDYFSSNIHCS